MLLRYGKCISYNPYFNPCEPGGKSNKIFTTDTTISRIKSGIFILVSIVHYPRSREISG